MRNSSKDINNVILFVVIGVYIFAQKYLTVFSPNTIEFFIISYFTSLGFYTIFVKILFWLVNNVEFLLKLYYNKIFIKGIWSYHYTLDNKVFFGIWNIEQDLEGIIIIGYGLNISGVPRSDVRSVSQLIYNKGAFDIVNYRADLIEPERENFSKTTLYPIIPRRGILKLKYPTKMRAKTFIYGGKLSGTVHVDVMFKKHEDASSEEEVKDQLLSYIKENYMGLY